MLLRRWFENSVAISDYYEATVPEIYSMKTLRVWIVW
jgi:hypothetical protein